MANLNNKIARIDVLIGGADQAKRQVEDMKRQWAELGKAVDKAKADMEASVNTVDYDKNKRKYEESLRQYKQTQRAIQETERNINTVDKYLSDLSGQTLRNLGQARKALNQMLQGVNPKDLKALNTVRDFIKQVADEAQRRKGSLVEFSDVIGDIGNVSEKSLSAVKQRLQDLVASTKLNEQEMQNYRDQLKQVEAEEQRRVAVKAQTAIGQVQGGTFSGTIAETKEAVKQLETFKQQLKTTDAAGIKEVDDAILKLNENIRQASHSSLSLDEALEQAAEVKSGNFKGTYEDLERLKKTLTEYKSEISVSDTKGLQNIHKALSDVEAAETGVKNGAVNVKETIDNIKTASLNDLKAAAAQLQAELNGTVRSEKEFIEKSAQLRQVNAEIGRMNKSWGEHDNAIVRVIKRLTAYVAVYGGFNMLLGKIKQMVSANLELSDSLADIRKTTGLSAEAINELSRSIDKIDTRTGQQQLHELAAVAGQIGLTSKEDVLGFVKASNMISVALNELGGEGTASLMKLAQLTGDVQKMGVEKSLLAIGSSINELSASSAATAGPIVDLMKRLGGIAGQSHITSAELAAIGATADALGQSMEITGTSMSKFIATLLSSSDKVAYAVNMDAKALREMIESGKVMDAVIAVMEKMNTMGGIANLKPIMGDLGSEGARMMTMLSAMANNVDFLKEQVDLSREAFTEATSIQNEYNVKNENAIAILQRLGNAIKEAFVNSGMVEVLRQGAQALMDFFKWITSNTESARLFISSIVALTAGLVAYKAAVIAASIASSNFGKTVKGLALGAKATVVAIVQYVGVLMGFTTSARAATTASINFGAALKALKAVSPAGWISIAVAALAGFFTWLYKTNSQVNELIKVQAKYNSELETEQMKVDALFYALDRYNIKETERKKIIDQINRQYGEYLGFMLSEKDSAERLAAAHRLVNAELRKKMALSLQSKLEENVNNQFADQLNKLMTSMTQNLSKAQGIGETYSREAVNLVSEIIRNSVDKPMYEILSAVREGLAQKYDAEQGTFGSSAFFDIQGDIKKFVQARKDYQNAVKTTTEYANREIESATSETVKEGINLLNQLNDKYNEIASMDITGLQKDQVEAHYKEMLDAAKNYVSAAQKQMERLGGDEKKNLQSVVDAYNTQIEDLKKKMPDADAWGKGLNLKGWKDALDNLPTASVESLVKVYKELQDAPKLISDVTRYNQMFGTSFTDLGQAMDDTRKKAKQIKDQLASYGRNTSGGFLWGGNRKGKTVTFGGVTRTEKEINDESTAALSALEAYYNREKGITQQAYIDQDITEEEMKRQLLKKDEQFLLDRIELRKRLLGKESTFDQTKYKQTDKDTGEVTDYFSGKNLDQLSGFIQQMGQRMTDGMLKQLTVDELKVMQAAAEHMKKIEKIILDNDFTGQVQKQYLDELEALELFWGKNEKVTQEGVDKRMAYLRMLSRDSYNMDSAGLQKRMSKYAEFGEWMKGRSAEDYQALLLMLQKYYDDTEEAENRELARRKRIADKQWTKSGKESAYNKQEQTDERNVSFVKNLNDLGIASDNQLNDTELLMYQHKLEAAQAYYDYLKKAGAETTDAERARNEALEDLSNKEIEITKSKLETLKSYTDAIVDFSEQMGEAAWGDVSDRQDAAKALLKTTMQLTKNLIMEQMKRLLMEKVIKQQEVTLESSTEAAKTAIQGQSAITNLTVEGAETVSQTASGIAKGSAKTIGQLGWWGIPLIAVISAALSALMGLAMGKLNKAKEEVASATGVSSGKGRVAAGMLTYAKGDYPVLGNDGQVYNAAYQKDLKTGVYGGGAHFGIFSEKKPEMIVDGDTTQKLILNYPHIYDSILTIANHGRLKSAMPTFAEGSYPSVPATVVPVGTDAGDGAVNPQMQETLSGVASALDALTERLKYPINATVDPYGKKGAVNTLKTSQEWMQRKGLIK